METRLWTSCCFATSHWCFSAINFFLARASSWPSPGRAIVVAAIALGAAGGVCFLVPLEETIHFGLCTVGDFIFGSGTHEGAAPTNPGAARVDWASKLARLLLAFLLEGEKAEALQSNNAVVARVEVNLIVKKKKKASCRLRCEVAKWKKVSRWQLFLANQCGFPFEVSVRLFDLSSRTRTQPQSSQRLIMTQSTSDNMERVPRPRWAGKSGETSTFNLREPVSTMPHVWSWIRIADGNQFCDRFVVLLVICSYSSETTSGTSMMLAPAFGEVHDVDLARYR